MRNAIEWDVWFAYPNTTTEIRFGTYSGRAHARGFARILRKTHGPTAIVRVVRVSVIARRWRQHGRWLAVSVCGDEWLWKCGNRNGRGVSCQDAIEAAEQAARESNGVF